MKKEELIRSIRNLKKISYNWLSLIFHKDHRDLEEKVSDLFVEDKQIRNHIYISNSSEDEKIVSQEFLDTCKLAASKYPKKEGRSIMERLNDEEYAQVLGEIFKTQILCLGGKTTDAYADEDLSYSVLMDIILNVRRRLSVDYISEFNSLEKALNAIKAYVLPESLALEIYKLNH